MKPVIIYHFPCPDGFASAYAAWLVFGDEADYVPAEHGSYPNLDVTGRDVFVLDFSFPRPMLEKMRESAASLVVLDHHKTAQEDLKDFPGAVFDMTKSGARLAWEHFQLGKKFPHVLQCVEDRDIWVWRIPGAADVLAYLDTLPYDFEVWHHIVHASPAELAAIQDAGRQMNRKFDSLAAVMAEDAEPVRLCGFDGHKVNGNYLFSSKVGELIYLKNKSFAMVWRVHGGMLYVSLRAKQGTVDVSEMARAFGGGGHAAAAAFRIPVGSPACLAFMTKYIFGQGE